MTYLLNRFGASGGFFSRVFRFVLVGFLLFSSRTKGTLFAIFSIIRGSTEAASPMSTGPTRPTGIKNHKVWKKKSVWEEWEHAIHSLRPYRASYVSEIVLCFCGPTGFLPGSAIIDMSAWSSPSVWSLKSLTTELDMSTLELMLPSPTWFITDNDDCPCSLVLFGESNLMTTALRRPWVGVIAADNVRSF